MSGSKLPSKVQVHSTPRREDTSRRSSVIEFPRRTQQSEVAPSASDIPSDHSLVSSLLRDFQLPTPFLALRTSSVEEIHNLFKQYLPFVDLFYAMKSNSTPALMKLLLSRGVGIDASSANELVLAIKCGAQPDQIIISNPFKDESLLYGMFLHGIHAFAVDSSNELLKVARFRDKHFPASNDCRPIIRVLVPAQGVEIDLGKKFGCTASDAVSLFKLAVELGFAPLGISFHVGTQCVHPESYGWAVDICSTIRAEVSRQLGHHVESLNIGGGFCAPDHARRHGVSYEEYFAKLAEILTPLRDEKKADGTPALRLCAEPGRILSSKAGIVVSRVLGRVDRPDGPAIYLNDGIYGCYSTRLVEHCEYEFTCIPESEGKHLSKLIPYTVFGPTCDSIDVISHGALLPGNIEVGDYVFSSGTGAYSISTACSFNGFAPPSVYLVSDQNGIEVFRQDGSPHQIGPLPGPFSRSVANET